MLYHLIFYSILIYVYIYIYIYISWIALYYLVKFLTFSTPNIKEANPKSETLL